MNENEKRVYFRYNFTELDHYKVTINNQHECKPLNISENGISITDLKNKLCEEIENNDILLLELNDLDNNINFKTKVSVKWIMYDCIGVEFLNLNDKTREIIDMIISHLIN
jgi:hypothetical protein